jgi:predicted Zn-dependent peptidase
MIRRNVSVFLSVCLVVGIAGSAFAQVDDYRDIKYPKLGKFEIPSPTVVELDNGLKIFLIEDHELPLIEVSARVRTGSVWEPVEKTGLARIMGAVQRTGGTANMTGDEIDDFLEARAASVETNVSTTVGFASMDCLVDDFDEVFGVFLEVLKSPQFSEDKIELAKVQANTGIARRNDDVGGITSREFNRLVYGYDSPLARIEEYATIDAISREDLLAWHGQYYHPNNIYLGVVGDFDTEEMTAKIKTAFSDWERGPDAAADSVAYQEKPKAGYYFIEKSDVTQANIRVGHLGITYDNPDYFAVQVMNEVLGGGFAARLFSRIRSEQGLAYNVGGGVRASFAYPGVAGFSMSTKSETMGESVDSLLKEITGMISEPATDAEVSRAKDSILNSFIFNYASRGQVLGQQMLYDYYGLPADFLLTYRDNIEKVTAEDVARVAGQYLHPDEVAVLVVGNSARFDRPMSSFGEFTEIDIEIPLPPAEEIEVEDTPENRAAGEEVFSRVAKALGGEDPAATSAIRTEASVQISIQGQSMTLGQEFLVVFPDMVHQVLKTPAGDRVVVVNGDEGFMMAMGQSQPMPADQVKKQHEELLRDYRTLVRMVGSDDLSVLLAGEEEIEGVDCQILVVEVAEVASRFWVDADGRILKQAYQGAHPFTQAPGEFEVFFTDYREVSGRLIPFVRKTLIDGSEFATSTSGSVEVNPEFDAAIFEKPAA